MSREKPTFIPDPRYWSEFQVACRLGISETKLSELRPKIERQGFPTRDPLFCERTDSKALEAWLDRRSHLSSPSEQQNEWEDDDDGEGHVRLS